MKPFRAIIIEDEPRSAELLEYLILQYCSDLEVIANVNDLEKAFKLISVEKPDLLFLDIEMNHQTAFELLPQLNDKNFDIIFTTAYERYAIKAIKVNALDYLLKPIDITELQEAVEKFKEKKLKSENLNRGDKSNIVDNTPNAECNLILSTLKEKYLVKPSEILYLQSERQYTSFYLKSGKMILTSKNIGEYEQILTPFNFFRCHHSFLVNLSEVKSYSTQGGYYAIMSNASKIEVSKRKNVSFIRQFQHTHLISHRQFDIGPVVNPLLPDIN